MRLEQSKLQRVKVVLHSIQGFLIFIAGCITIALFTKSSKGDGRTVWYFLLCFLTMPALIYQVGVPMWSRSIRFAKAYAFVAVDVVYTIFWLSAFAAVAAWNRAGLLQGASDKKIDTNDANCTVFAYGSEGACRLAYADVSFGALIFFLFIGTSIISVLYVKRIRENPAATEDPWLAKGGGSGAQSYGGLEARAASTDPVWDPDTREIDNPFSHHDDDGRDGYGAHDLYRGSPDHDRHPDDEHTLLHSTETDDGAHPGRQVPWGRSPLPVPPLDTEYHGAYGASYPDPSALSPGGRPSPLSAEGLPAYEQFPSRGQGRGGASYS